MKTVLSTKVLTPSQKELFLNSGLGLVEYDALHIEFLKPEIPNTYQNLIFTSKNAVKGFLQLTEGVNYSEYKVFCVGEKTERFLQENGLFVIKMAENSFELAKYIVKNHKNEAFLFLSGNLRMEDLPETLSKNNIRYEEVEIYRTHLNANCFNRKFDGLLFFSPSGVRSYLLENSFGNEMAFCIGPTTAVEAKKHTDQVIVATKPTVENVLVQAINYFKKHD